MTKGITRERIVTAALDLLDDKGMDGLTVRALATRLDVRAPALYWHVRNKQELLDEMATEVMRRVTGTFAAIPPGAGWRDDLAAYARVLRSEYLLHRDGARTFSGTRLTDPGVVRMKEPWFERWTASGLTSDDADDAVDLVTAFVVGFVIEEQERHQAADDGDHRFERHLGIVLDGLAARLGR